MPGTVKRVTMLYRTYQSRVENGRRLYPHPRLESSLVVLSVLCAVGGLAFLLYDADRMSPDFLRRSQGCREIARENWECAEGLPRPADQSFSEISRRLDSWAAHIRSETDRQFCSCFQISPSHTYSDLQGSEEVRPISTAFGKPSWLRSPATTPSPSLSPWIMGWRLWRPST